MSIVVVDEKYRILLGKQLRQTAGVRKGDRLIAIPYKDGVTLLSLKGKRFTASLKGFGYTEEQHEASRYLFRKE